MESHGIGSGGGSARASGRSPAFARSLPLLDRRRFVKLLGGAVVLAPGVAALAACGDDDDDAAPTTTGNERVEPYRATQAVFRLDTVGAAPFVIADHLGFYAEEGLELETLDFSDGTEAIRSLASGTEFSVPSPTQFLAARAQEPQAFSTVRIVAGYQHEPPIVFLSRSGQGIETVSDLAGKKVGVSSPNSLGFYFATRIRDEVGGDLEIVPVGGPPDAKTALDQGLIDAAWSAPPLSTIMVQSGDYIVAARAGDLVPAFMANVLVTQQPVIDERPDAVTGWLRALGRAIDLITDDPERAATAWAEGVNFETAGVELQVDLAQAVLAEVGDVFSLELDERDLQGSIEAAMSIGELETAPDIDEIIVDDLVPEDVGG